MDGFTLWLLVFALGLFFGVILILRELTLWYFRINQRYDKLDAVLKEQQQTNLYLAEMVALMKNENAHATTPPSDPPLQT